MPESRSSWGCRETGAPSSAALTAPPGDDQRGQILGRHAQAERLRQHEGVERTAPRDVRLDLAGVDATGGHARRHVDERHLVHRAGRTTHTRGDAPRRDVDHHVDPPIGGSRDAPGFHRPRTQRNRSVPARGRVAVLVPEQHAEGGTLVVGRDDEAAVHVGMAARLVTQQPAQTVDTLRRRGALAPLSHVRARDLPDVTDDDPEWLTGRVVVRCTQVHPARFSTNNPMSGLPDDEPWRIVFLDDRRVLGRAKAPIADPAGLPNALDQAREALRALEAEPSLRTAGASDQLGAWPRVTELAAQQKKPSTLTSSHGLELRFARRLSHKRRATSRASARG
jgi:hypothetical protein